MVKEFYLAVLGFAVLCMLFSTGVQLCRMRREQKRAMGYRDSLQHDAAYDDYLDYYENDGYDDARR